MCKLRRITHKLYKARRAFSGFMLNLWVIRRSLHIDKNQKINFIPYNSNFGTKQHICKGLLIYFKFKNPLKENSS